MVALAAPVVFPLLPIVDGPEGLRCACGNGACGRVGKHPAVAWGELSYGDEVPRPAPGAGVGIKTGAAPRGSNVIVVDLDGPDAQAAWLERFRDAREDEPPDTLTVSTGREGGLQLYFEHPGFRVRNSAGELAPGIDIRGDGGFVVAPGSPHRSGRTYTILKDGAPALAPTWLLDWLRARATPDVTTSTSYPGDVLEPHERARRRALYTKYLRDDAPPRGPERRGRGDATLFDVVQRGAYDLGLPTEDVLELVREHYDPRCSPTWGDELEERVRHKANDAKTRSTRPRLEPLPADLDHLTIVGGVRGSLPDVIARAPPTASTSPLTPSPFQFVYATELSKPLPQVPYVVRYFGIAPGRPTLLAGYGGVGKTFIVQCLALHIAAGLETCWGLHVSSGPIRHFDYEMTLHPTQRRYQRLARGHGLDLRSCDLGVASMPSLYLSDDAAEDALARATEGVTLAILDNLAAATVTAEKGENDSYVRRYLDRLTRVTAKTGCTFLVLVHERKAGKDEVGGLQRVRGSSAITDAAGTVISVSASDGDGVITLGQTKASLRKKQEDLTLQIEDVWPTDGAVGPDDEDAPGLRVQRLDERPASEKSSKLQAKVVELLSKGPQETKQHINRALGLRSGAANAEVDALLVRREIRRVPGRGFVLDSTAARRERVVHTVMASGSHKSVAELAKAAYVDTDVVNDALRDGAICKSADGQFLVVSR